jgi:membrane-associated phospholipid phosphatase
MNSVIVWVAQDLLFVLAVVVAGLVLAAPYGARWRSAAAGVLSVGVVVVLIAIAAALHTDPRPFVVDRALHPLFAHGTDNGFPSDHSAAAGLLTVLAWRLRAFVGGIVAVCAGLVAAARVIAHVHHVQDVVAGLLLGALASLIAIAIVDGFHSLVTARRQPPQRLGRHL